MDLEKQIRILENEQEFLLEEIEQLKEAISTKDALLEKVNVQVPESEAALRSTIASNLVEIDFLKTELDAAANKLLAAEYRHENTELEFLEEIKQNKKNKTTISNLTSSHAQVQALQEELADVTILYQKVVSLKKELSEFKSKADLLQTENECLQNEISELKALVSELSVRKKQ
jgi:predicted  nucleic acid-binding Zn-ribbon protein